MTVTESIINMNAPGEEPSEIGFGTVITPPLSQDNNRKDSSAWDGIFK